MKPNTLATLLAFAVGSTAWGSPYDQPYGTQWNFSTGAPGLDVRGGNRVDVTSDGTIFVANGAHSSQTWGFGATGSINGGMGAISPLGAQLFGSTLRGLPGMNNPNQSYSPSVTAAGNTAYFNFNASGGQFWTGEDGKDNNRAMVFSMDSSGLNSIANQHSLSVFAANDGTPRTDSLKPTTTGLTPATGSNRIQDSALRVSTLDMVMVMDMVGGDFGTAGDYEGWGLRQSNGNYRNDAFLAGIGVYNFTNNTLTGPAKQPLVTFDTSADVFEVTDVQCVADSAGSLNDTYFDVNGKSGTHRFWYDVDDTGVAPADPGAGVFEIDITADATADAVAAATQPVIDALDDFGATVTTDTVTVTDAHAGTPDDAVDSGATGFTITVTAQGFKAAGSNFSVYICCGIDQATGSYYGGGLSHARGESSSDAFDPDGSGPAAAIPISGPVSMGTAYDSAGNLLYSVVWDTAGYDQINFIKPSDDGTNACFWAGEYDDAAYVEKRDASGTVIWSDSINATVDTVDSPGVERVVSVDIDSGGDLFVTGYFQNEADGGADGGADAYDTFVRKYKKNAEDDYSMVWHTSGGLPGIRDLAQDGAIGSDGTFYTFSDTFGQWDTNNPTLHTYAGNADILVLKWIPGDFADGTGAAGSDGIVDFNDVQFVGDATNGGGAGGTDTYDFDKDGDSTFPADVNHLITELMDRVLSDIHQDALATDVDNADIGKAIGNSGVGTLYVDGDTDWDGDVDATDIAAVAAAFTGAETPGSERTVLPTGATLLYNPDTGEVYIKADEADGGAITSFQIENSEGTFVPANLVAPTGGGFGGTYAEATTDVIGDTDTTLSGFSGLPSLGTILPTGLDLAGLEAYLTTAVYTGAPGTGQKDFTLEVGSLTDYDIWALDYPGADLTDPDADLDGDGLSNDTERLFGLDPGDPSSNSPITVGLDADAGTLSFTRRDVALTGTFSSVETSTDLVNWIRDAGATLTPGAPVDDVETVMVTLSPGLLAGPALYVRTVQGDGTLFSSNFEDDNGGFTVTTTAGSDWAHGAPDSVGFGGQTISTGNGGSTNCWGTNIGNPGYYILPTTTVLSTPPIDLSGVTNAELSFAEAIDLEPGDTAQVFLVDHDTGLDIGAALYSASDLDDTSAPWEAVPPMDISAGAGETIRIEWRFTGGTADYMGWYIDDVAVKQGAP